MAALHKYVPNSRLEKLINGREYGVQVQPGRKNGGIMFVQEPVGYLYFSDRNIAALTEQVRQMFGSHVEYNDFEDIMVNLFHTHVSSVANYVDHNNSALVHLRLKAANMVTIQEISKRFGSVHNLHQQYQAVLDHPNLVPALPDMTSKWSRTQEHAWYGEDTKESELPQVQPMDEDLNGILGSGSTLNSGAY